MVTPKTKNKCKGELLFMDKQRKIRKSLLTATITTSLVTSAFIPFASANSFTDVTAKYQDAIDFIVSKGILGFSSTEFGVNEAITRLDAAMMLAKVLNLSDEQSSDTGFTDVPDDRKWITTALKQAGITQGKTEEKFDPYSPITRGELAIWIYKAFELQGSGSITFKDVNKRYEEAVQALVFNEVTQGITSDEFGISKNAKRGDFTLFLKKAYDASQKKNEEDAFTLSLIHTNDTHANLDYVAKRVTAVKEVRTSKPHALLVDAGDVFSGTLYFNEFKGQADLAFLNVMKYDLATFGNHEFDLGSSSEGHKALADYVKGASFPFISSNIDFSKDDNLKDLYNDAIENDPKNGKIYNAILKEVNGEKIGFFGLTTEETSDISSPGAVIFENYLEEAKKAVTALEQQGVNKIVAITHLGYDDNPAIDNDLTLAAEVDGIDVIVGGHSHTQLDEPVVVNQDEDGQSKDPTIIVQAYQYNEYLGTVDVKFDKEGKVIGQAGELIKISDKEEDTEASELLKPYADKILEVKNTLTGATALKELTSPRDGGDTTKPSVRKNETELGNLIADGMLSKAKEFNPNTVIAFQNGGGIRTNIDQGEITLGEILTVLPFGNTLATIELSGAEMKEALEHSVRLAPAENGGFLHVSGMKFTYDSTKEAGNRVGSMQVKEEDGSYTDIQQDSTYIVATNAFTAKGGDGFTVFQQAYSEGRMTDLGLADWENLRDYVSKVKNIDPQIEGRILDSK